MEELIKELEKDLENRIKMKDQIEVQYFQLCGQIQYLEEKLNKLKTK